MKQIQEMLKTLPEQAGVYQYYDKDQNLLYIGKAKNLKKRVSSYFNKSHDSTRLRMLVKKIADVKYLVVDSEYDALLLENTLIKKHQPRYNVNLKDDKTYPWLCIKNERFPRVISTRRLIKDGSAYFGPYPSGKALWTLIELGQKLFKLRTCSYNLSQENISRSKFRVCLEYHIGNCLGPCEAKQDEEEYMKGIQQFKDIVRGEMGLVKKYLKDQMALHVANLEFEQANDCKARLEALENYQSRSSVVSPTVGKVDVCSILMDQDSAYINYLRVSNGCVIQGLTIELKKRLEETEEELLIQGLIELRQRFNSDAKEVLVPFELEISSEAFQTFVPIRGDKKKLLDLSQNNARAYLVDKLKHQKITDPEEHQKRLLAQMRKDLRLMEDPLHIECFDNSNIQGTNPVSACVVFRNLKPSKKDYRHFNVKTVEGPDDFATMEEVIWRRYSRMLEENEPLPNLIVIDGGKGQLGAALKSLKKLGLQGQIAIIGIAKRLEEIYYPGDSLPLYLDKKSESLKVIQHLRNEAHRFGISHHRNRRSKQALKSELDDIKGIGLESKKELLLRFKSVAGIFSASDQELIDTIGQKRAGLLIEYIRKNKGH